MPCAVILTALSVEYLAVRRFLTEPQEEIHPQGTIYERGKFVTANQTWEVGIAEVGAGNAGAAVEAERAIAHFKPDILFFVGIAGGIKDVQIGDVVAATKVYGYESGKDGEHFSTRPKEGQSAFALVKRAMAEARKGEWVQRLCGSTENPRVFVAPIAAGEKVLASRDSKLFQFLRTSYDDAIAVEMEGFGFLSAAFAYPDIKAIVIRGISDLVKDKNKPDPIEGSEEKRQEKASQHASAFAFEILAKLNSELTSVQVSQEDKLAKPTPPDFFAYDDAWVGRDSLIRGLSDRIRSSCRLLMLVGITGIGKTALSERLAVEVADWFGNDWSHYHQENFDNDQQSADFVSVAARWLDRWGKLVTPDDLKDPKRLLHRLLTHMQENRYLVQMDSLENILQGNEDEGWNDFKDQWWLKFFEAYLKSDFCKSSIILTTQDFPGQIEEAGTRTANFWYCQPLSGLEQSEQIALFEKIELDISSGSESRSLLERIGTAYEGHPLALRVIAGEVKSQPFDGNVLAYWHKYRSEFEEVEKAIAEAQKGNSTGIDKFQLDRFTKTLRRNVRSRLDKTFNRLQEDARWAYILLCESSVYRCSVPEGFWLSHLEDWNQSVQEQKAALDTLRERYLVEELIDHSSNQHLVRQHNLIRSLSLVHLQKLDELLVDE